MRILCHHAIRRWTLSRRKDRERFLAMKDSNPDYQGFRGYVQEPVVRESTPLQTVTCSVCGRRRNVSVDVATEQGENYVCLSCREEAEQEEEAQPEEISS
jgi:DNA-directed RNA polymerase subunit RPC12/RpoP